MDANGRNPRVGGGGWETTEYTEYTEFVWGGNRRSPLEEEDAGGLSFLTVDGADEEPDGCGG